MARDHGYALHQAQVLNVVTLDLIRLSYRSWKQESSGRQRQEAKAKSRPWNQPDWS